ncbi:hypothetical protein QP794_10790 [Paenibacillus sp. UMB7766-LJ446]|nr:hypothetical protein [Paenibacillus sp. UMB7766-LJ446]
MLRRVSRAWAARTYRDAAAILRHGYDRPNDYATLARTPYRMRGSADAEGWRLAACTQPLHCGRSQAR